MKQPEYSGDWWAVHNSDCIEGMHAMPENSIDCAIFSPPFGDLFVYSDSERDLGNAAELLACIALTCRCARASTARLACKTLAAI